ncbi:hypothetical protein VST7929_02404 [Vibrio stylophorae]|uniref:MSHA biogenesis protein MshA n=1 Tax=Vibrio stylophorae TaxID=659351 RepID=A0ABN8DTV1_9VIBR|nr:type II secretion system protein [Vibrio stylophorae]CAH0534471.1 hypothetical protein VST7929_02404 [Vibrio stylophorae]
MKKQAGFTLIELVVVIVILGILAVTAAPKFLGMQEDARGAALQGVVAAVKGANSQVYAKAAVAGQEKANPGEIDVNGTKVATTFGYVTAADLSKVVELSDWDLGTAGEINFKPAITNCKVTYAAPAADGDAPTITVVESGC